MKNTNQETQKQTENINVPKIEAEEIYAKKVTAEEIIMEEPETETNTAVEVKFQPMEFVDNLSYMGLGMLGIFVVIGVIITITASMNKFFK